MKKKELTLENINTSLIKSPALKRAIIELRKQNNASYHDKHSDWAKHSECWGTFLFDDM